MSQLIKKTRWFDIIRTGLDILAEIPVPEEGFDLICSCAVHDRPYLLRYRKTGGGRYTFMESVKLPNDRRGGTNRTGASQALPNIDLKLIEAKWKCAWCGENGFAFCSDCNTYVCTGLQRGDLFRCRRSCGVTWVGVPLDSITGATRRSLRGTLNPGLAPSSRALTKGSGASRGSSPLPSPQLPAPFRRKLLGGK